jgi:hypothetical protein
MRRRKDDRYRAKEWNPIFPLALDVLHWGIVDSHCIAGLPGQTTETFCRMNNAIKKKVRQFVTENGNNEGNEFSIA